MTIIKISSANLLPFGLLSNHYPFEFSIDDIDYKKQITYNNVSQYIYENMIPYDVYYRTIIKNTKPEKMYETFMDYSRKIHNKTYLELLKQAFDKKSEDVIFRRNLLNTKNKKLYYINPNNLLLGMKTAKNEGMISKRVVLESVMLLLSILVISNAIDSLRSLKYLLLMKGIT